MEIDAGLYSETPPRFELPPATINLLCGLAHETKAILYALMRPDENTGYFTVGPNYEQALALTGKLMKIRLRKLKFQPPPV